MLLRCASALSRLPLGVHYAFADCVLYPVMYYVVRYRRAIVQKNLRLAFPDKSEAERKQIAKNGQEKVLRDFSYMNLLPRILSEIKA